MIDLQKDIVYNMIRCDLMFLGELKILLTLAVHLIQQCEFLFRQDAKCQVAPVGLIVFTDSANVISQYNDPRGLCAYSTVHTREF